MSDRLPRSRGGFTLVELLVAVLVVALLVGLLLPALAAARSTGRAAVCLANTRTLALALSAFAADHGGGLVPVRRDEPAGRRWWFGFEPGPVGGTKRPIELTGSPLALYTADLAAGVSCPDFPRDDPGFVPKFATPSAHFGLNGGLCLPGPTAEPKRLVEVRDAAGTFAFADAVHQDFSATRFHEPHEVAFRGPGAVSGAGHFRHGRETAHASFLDGHAAAREAPGSETVWATFAGGPVVNLDVYQGERTLYGFRTWTAGLLPGTVRP